MYPEKEPETPAGYETWRPRMGPGGRFLVWLILAMIAVGTVLMALSAFG